ncbi:uncharacterized protein BJX67DRAFT_369009 [Aspergillus lucknowensis]|uniref:HNH nuclease domain-containing protein n=1 Tax=Aspergillus lucknowensis TaxID=176173 RepID=A0ABR4M6R4_9EURO
MASNKRQAPGSPDPLYDESRRIKDELRVVEKRMTGKSSWNATFWAASCEFERKVSLREFGGPESEWEKTDAAKSIFQFIKAGKKMVERCEPRKEDRKEETWPKLRRLRASWMQLGAQRPEYDSLWCPILGTWVTPPELFSARNGLLMLDQIEHNFDGGKLVIVPDLPDRPALKELAAWVKRETREYRVRIIDKTWEKLDHPIMSPFKTTWSDLDGKRLEFRTSFRPAAQYLYFHYYCQILRRAWGRNNNGGAYEVLKDEAGRLFWGTPGRYLPRNMLLGLVEDLGHEYKGLLQGAGCSKGDNDLLLEVVTKQIKTRPALKDIDWDQPRNGEDDEDEGEDEEYDGDATESD